MDKKSVVVVLGGTADAEARFVGDEEKTYDFQIGEHNGVLGVIEKRVVSSIFEVPDEEEVIVMYAPSAWQRAYQE